MSHLNINIIDIPGFTCCPEAALVKSMGEDIWLLTAARNLAVAEKHDPHGILVTPCNGCSSTLKTAYVELAESPEKRARINALLEHAGLHYEGSIRVKHIVEFLHQDVGVNRIQERVIKPLVGMQVAVHAGCHLDHPHTPAMFGGTPVSQQFEDILDALSADFPDYATREMCCGQELARVDAMDDSLQMMRTKLLDVSSHGYDALTVCCPACFMQFDQRQFLLQRQGEEYNIPVMFLTELIALSVGLNAQDIGLYEHRVSTERFLQRYEENLKEYEKAQTLIDLDLVRNCYECGACVDDCPVALIDERFDPQHILGLLLKGRLDDALEEGGFWLCVQCHTCSELCPQKLSMENIFEYLRREAMRRGIMPKMLKMGADMFEQKGVLAEVQQRLRRKLNLPDLPESGDKDLAKLLKKLHSGD